MIRLWQDLENDIQDTNAVDVVKHFAGLDLKFVCSLCI